MKIIVCLDDKNGMLFNRRRQSRDSALRGHVLEMTGSERLWMNSYSAAQFEELPDRVEVDEDFLEKAGENDFCFLENADISAYAGQVTGVIIYRWNREYPRDMIFPEECFSGSWKLAAQGDFPGNSHEKITWEVYEL